MSTIESAPVKQAGNIVLPKGVRSAGDLKEGDTVVLELSSGGQVMLRLAYVEAPPAPEEYTLERKAEFLLSNAVSESDYQAAQQEVRALGLDPDKIPHYRHSQE